MTMILASDCRLPTDQVIERFCTDSFGNLLENAQPFYIIREASKEEWRQDVIASGGDPGEWDCPYFYEISTD